MAAKPLPDQSILRQLFDFDPDRGTLHWRARQAATFSRPENANAWNARFAGRKAGTLSSTGYFKVQMKGGVYSCHRLIWRLVFNEEPPEIDHINGDRLDNRLSNLRAADRGMNTRNRSISKNNTSGFIGVSLCRRTGRWVAYATYKGSRARLGYFATREAAAAARKSIDADLGFSPTHGRS